MTGGLRLIRRSAEDGWTFVETIIVIAVIVLLTGTVALSSVKYIDRARCASARLQIDSLSLALQAYYIDTGLVPTEAQGLASLWQRPVLAPSPDTWAGPYLDRRPSLDPWGRTYEYRSPGPDGLLFEIVCYGSDGLPGGDGSAHDLSSAQ